MTTAYLYQLYSKPLNTYFRTRVKDAELAGDLTQEVFIKVHTRIAQLKEKQNPFPWILSIAKNTMVDHYRRNQKIAAAREIGEVPVEEKEKEPELSKCALPMIKGLPAKYREALMEVEIKGVSQKSFAEKLQISYSGAKSRVQRAKLLLKQSLIECCHITHDKYGNVLDHVPRGQCSKC
jgi:RNA polymerase sigma-70 factor, ECF subfamily